MATEVFTNLPNQSATQVTSPAGTITFYTTLTLTVPGLPAANNESRVVAVTAPALEADVYITGWRVTAQNTLKVLLYQSTGLQDTVIAAQMFEVIVA